MAAGWDDVVRLDVGAVDISRNGANAFFAAAKLQQHDHALGLLDDWLDGERALQVFSSTAHLSPGSGQDCAGRRPPPQGRFVCLKLSRSWMQCSIKSVTEKGMLGMALCSLLTGLRRTGR